MPARKLKRVIYWDILLVVLVSTLCSTFAQFEDCDD
jgi:hypothetical protein